MVINLSEETISTVIAACNTRIYKAAEMLARIESGKAAPELREKYEQEKERTQDALAIFEELQAQAELAYTE